MPVDRGHMPLSKLTYYYLREFPAIVWDTFVILVLR